MRKSVLKKIKANITGPVIVLAILILIFSFLAGRFFSLSNAVNIIRQGSVLALAAFGQTFVILVAGIDLSVGAVMGLASCTAAMLMLKGVSVANAALIALLVAVLCGTVNGLVINYIGLDPFVATFGMWGMAIGGALVITEERVLFGFSDKLARFSRRFRPRHSGPAVHRAPPFRGPILFPEEDGRGNARLRDRGETRKRRAFPG